jgi:hypothetical protein
VEGSLIADARILRSCDFCALVTAGIVGALVAVPLHAVLNTAVRYLVSHPGGEPTPDREAPGTQPTDKQDVTAEQDERQHDRPAGTPVPPPAETSVSPLDEERQSLQN